LGNFRNTGVTHVLCFQVSMEFPGPGIFLAPSPIGLVRNLIRRATLVPARRDYQKVSSADLPSHINLEQLFLLCWGQGTNGCCT
jgi:hypothetical protein